MTEDKSKLLRSLTIDRSADKAERSGNRWLPISAAIVACVVGFAAFAAYEFRKDDPPKETAQQSAAPPQTSQPQPSPPKAAASSKPAGTLAASGYVVARRKATVAAEITGKVVEVFIDEGMTVTEGQVVARLDSVLAEKDFELARSRAETADAAIAAITADLEDATRIMTRIQTLSQKNFATEADLTKAQARVGVLNAQLRQAKSQFETASIDARRSGSVLDKHEIRAPFAGVVTTEGRAARRNRIAGGGGRRLHAHRHLHDRRHEFARSRSRGQRILHRPRESRPEGATPRWTPIRTGTSPPRSTPSFRPPTATRRR